MDAHYWAYIRQLCKVEIEYTDIEVDRLFKELRV